MGRQTPDQVFRNAVQLLESMKPSLPCSRIAAMRLVTSCQDLAGRSIESEAAVSEKMDSLDKTKATYAARLALCELQEAGRPIPKPCLPIHVIHDIRRSRDTSQILKVKEGHGDRLPTDIVTACLRTLESRPQWWTSYSNNRQNAVVICQAARIDLEKEEALKLHRLLVANTANLNKDLHDALHDAAAEMDQHMAFAKTVKALREQLIMDIENDSVHAKSIFNSFISGLNSMIGPSVTRLQSLLSCIASEANDLGEVSTPCRYSLCC